MNNFSNNLVNNFPEYLFNKINTQKQEARKEGRDVIDLGYGNPDIPSHSKVVDKLIESARNKKNHNSQTRYLLFYLSIIILFLEWLYNHPSLRYGGYAVVSLMFFIPISLYLEKFELDLATVKRKVYFLLILSALIFFSKNLN